MERQTTRLANDCNQGATDLIKGEKPDVDGFVHLSRVQSLGSVLKDTLKAPELIHTEELTVQLMLLAFYCAPDCTVLTTRGASRA